MNPDPESSTRKTLIARVQAGDRIAWEEFYNTYKVFIRRVALGVVAAKHYRFTDEDIADLIQNVMFDLWKPGKFRYDPTKGIPFRGWFKRVVLNKLHDLNRKKTSLPPAAGAAKLPPPEKLDEDFAQAWEGEWTRWVHQESLRRLSERVEPKTFQAFEMLLAGKNTQAVAECLGLKVNAVYQVRSRCIQQLKSLIAELENSDVPQPGRRARPT